jgi:site-specific recombinase XerD
MLPLLDAVARALACYLSEERPQHAQDRTVFVSDHLPHGRLAGPVTIRHRLACYAAKAGVRAAFLGTHVFRHSHAVRQVECGALAKTIGDILGHRSSESTSVYVRGAIQAMRSTSLAVPR